MKRYKAVLFDFDGVLGDTLQDGCDAWRHAFSSVGIEFIAEEYYLAEGKRGYEFVRQVLIRENKPESLVDDLVKMKSEVYAARHQFKFFPRAQELSNRLMRSGVKLGVVSGGSRDRLLTGPSGELLSSFDSSVIGDDVIMGKPAPDCYLLAANQLGVLPSECLVIENAPLGIAAAKAAGMECYAVTTTLRAEHLSQADQIFTSLAAIEEQLIQIGIIPE